MSNELMNQEIREAIEAGETALISLREAQAQLNSARNWGILICLAAAFSSSMIKRSKMDDSRSVQWKERSGFNETSKRTSGYSDSDGFKA